MSLKNNNKQNTEVLNNGCLQVYCKLSQALVPVENISVPVSEVNV